ncbi:hypothetical protein [Joostella sp. CR20]|uniref:hypothetical protein n=1 Tax=Joostella sp. CR20 TaxID=2804312 RepID=UPI00313E435F
MSKDKTNMETKGFAIPENYFQEFDNRLSKRIASAAGIPEASGFVVPKGYFEKVETEILSKTLPKKKTKVIQLSWFYKAAAVAAVFLIGFFISKNSNSTITDFNQIAISDINDYIENGYVSLNAYDISDTFNDVSFNDIEIDETINEDEIFNYLEENISSYNDLSLDEE